MIRLVLTPLQALIRHEMQFIISAIHEQRVVSMLPEVNSLISIDSLKN